MVAGFAGFAFSAVAGAILLHFFQPSLAIPLMMFCSISSQLGSIIYLRKTLPWTQSLALLMGGAFGACSRCLSILYLIDVTSSDGVSELSSSFIPVTCCYGPG